MAFKRFVGYHLPPDGLNTDRSAVPLVVVTDRVPSPNINCAKVSLEVAFAPGKTLNRRKINVPDPESGVAPNAPTRIRPAG